MDTGINPSEFGQLKVYYIIPCFRNEGIENLSSTKRREFNQIGLEYIGSQDLDADIEAFYLCYKGLNSITNPKNIIALLQELAM